jgi:hypothetical protein
MANGSRPSHRHMASPHVGRQDSSLEPGNWTKAGKRCGMGSCTQLARMHLAGGSLQQLQARQHRGSPKAKLFGAAFRWLAKWQHDLKVRKQHCSLEGLSLETVQVLNRLRVY